MLIKNINFKHGENVLLQIVSLGYFESKLWLTSFVIILTYSISGKKM